MTHDLANCGELQAGTRDVLHTLRLEIGPKAMEDHLVEGRELITRYGFPRSDGDVPPASDGEDPAAPARRPHRRQQKEG